MRLTSAYCCNLALSDFFRLVVDSDLAAGGITEAVFSLLPNSPGVPVGITFSESVLTVRGALAEEEVLELPSP